MKIIEQTDRMVVIRTEAGMELILTEKTAKKEKGWLSITTDTGKLYLLPNAENSVTIIPEKH